MTITQTKWVPQVTETSYPAVPWPWAVTAVPNSAATVVGGTMLIDISSSQSVVSFDLPVVAGASGQLAQVLLTNSPSYSGLPIVLTLTEVVNGQTIQLGSTSFGGGSGAFVNFAIVPQSNLVKVNFKWNGTPYKIYLKSIWIRKPQLQQATLLVDICDGVKDKYKYGFNGQEKVNEWAGIGNHTTALFWEYDTRTAQRLNTDPVIHPWESSYSTLGRNPIWYTDVLGDDWYKDKGGAVQFDPKIQSPNDLGKGEKYLGDTYKEKKRGNINYRKDGSIMFSNETDAYNRMWTASKEPRGGTTTHEVMGLIMNKGVLVLPDYKNNSTTSEVEKFGYKLFGGKLYDPLDKTTTSLLATIHTHQADFRNGAASDPPGVSDRQYFPSVTPNKPFLTMGKLGGLHAMYGDSKGVGYIELPKGYNTVKNLLSGASLIQLFKSR